MGFFSNVLSKVATAIGTVIGVVAESASSIIRKVYEGYEKYKDQGLDKPSAIAEKKNTLSQELRDINDELIWLRKKSFERGLRDDELERGKQLQSVRATIKEKLNQLGEIRAAQEIIENKESFENVEIDDEHTHILQSHADHNIYGKTCGKCKMPMKLQWPITAQKAKIDSFYWGCTGWYRKLPNGQPSCTFTEKLKPADFTLFTDMDKPEFELSTSEFTDLVLMPGPAKIIRERMDDLKRDLDSQGRGVEIASCPLHGENMVLKLKNKPTGLLDQYFLACPRWLPNSQGCTFMQKIKSPGQMSSLLRDQTGSGVL